MKLGSLFDGSGTCPLVATMLGIEPVWASEVEPFPIAVTRKNLPSMKHYGNIMDMNGAEVEPVDVITFGSPCQDLSVAGKRAGIQDGERSNLFFEAIRIIKEMREATNGEYPRFIVWENVPGAFSSNKGHDFHAVLEAVCQVSDANVSIPEPCDKRKPDKLVWSKAGEIVADDYSVAWRTLDAQFWGVPQRRKRIFLVADFASQRAGEILFKQDGLRGDSAESGEAWQSVAADVDGCTGGSSGVECLVLHPVIALQANAIDRADTAGCNGAGWRYDASYTLNTVDRHAVCFEPKSALEENWAESQVKNALRAGASKSSHAVCCPQIAGTLCASGAGLNRPAGQANETDLCIVERGKPPRKYILRRLTPTECARLQGFPDWWTQGLGIEEPTEEDVAFWADVFETHRVIAGTSSKPKSRNQLVKWIKNPNSDSAEYKMWGNGMCRTCVLHVLSGIKNATRGANSDSGKGNIYNASLAD